MGIQYTFLEKMLFAVLVIVFGCFISHSNGQAGVGQECWSPWNGVHTGGCADGLMCSHWNEVWDGQSPWYCLFAPEHTEGEICNYDLKVGLCASGLSCCNGRCASGTCQTPTPNPSCVDTGLPGFNLCYNGNTSTDLGQQCCPDFYTGSAQVYCLPTEDTPANTDRYCMRYNITLGETCGRSAETNYAGVCQSDLVCNNETNICENVCSPDGIKCWDSASLSPVEGVTCCGRCDITDLFVDANCSGSTGSCSNPGQVCFPPTAENQCCDGSACNIVGADSGKCP